MFDYRCKTKRILLFIEQPTPAQSSLNSNKKNRASLKQARKYSSAVQSKWHNSKKFLFLHLLLSYKISPVLSSFFIETSLDLKESNPYNLETVFLTWKDNRQQCWKSCLGGGGGRRQKVDR